MKKNLPILRRGLRVGGSKIIRIGLPKGSLEETTISLFEKAGWRIKIGERELYPTIDDPAIEVVMLRAQEMARYVEQGTLDCGLTGRDWVIETGAKVKEICSLTYSKTGFRKVKWVVAVRADSPIKTIQDLNGKLVVTEVVNISKNFLRENRIQAKVDFSWGATEAKPRLFADAIVEVTETGRSLEANNLRILETVMESETVLIANRELWKNNKWKRTKIKILALMLTGAIAAESKVGLKMNVPEKVLKKVIAILPALHTPTISRLSEKGWYSLETIVDEKRVRLLIPLLKKAGASGIIEYPLNKLIY